jgi:glycosyltransferase involved in cell wall biosynthesis
MPGPIRSLHARRERDWARRSDGLTTVNEALADRLAARWGRRPTVVPNYPEVAESPVDPVEPGPLRRALGVGRDVPVVLFQGRLGPRLGLDEAAEAVLAVPGAILAVLGFGRGFDRERARDDEPRFAGRHRTLPAVHPDELLAWSRDADVSLIPLPPVSVNQQLSSPNKLWESLAAGTPVVVPSGLTLMAGLVRDEDLGVVAASPAAPDLALAIRSALDRLATDPGWRARISRIAADRHSWPVAAAAYRDLLDRLVTGSAVSRSNPGERAPT